MQVDIITSEDIKFGNYYFEELFLVFWRGNKLMNLIHGINLH